MAEHTGPLVDELEALRKRALKLDGEPRINADPKDLARIEVLEGLIGEPDEPEDETADDPRAVEERLLRGIQIPRLVGELARRLEDAKTATGRPELRVALNNLKGVGEIAKDLA